MKLLKKKQKHFIFKRDVKVNELHMFPRFGFNVYSEPNGESQFINLNPFTKSLDHELFLVKEKVGKFYKGNFHRKPIANDFYLTRKVIDNRSAIEVVFLFIVAIVPFLVYNTIKSGYRLIWKKKELI